MLSLACLSQMKVFIYFRYLAVGYRSLHILPVSSMLASLAAIIEAVLPFGGGAEQSGTRSLPPPQSDGQKSERET